MPRLTEWVFENLGLVVVMAIAAFSFLRSVFSTLRGGGEKPRPRTRQQEDPEAAERTRRVQEEIRRKIAERREMESASAERQFEAEEREEREILPPLMRPRELQPVDPFGGPMRKVMRRLEEAAEQRVEQWTENEDDEVLARQRRLEEQMRALEVARAEERRRAAELVPVLKRSEQAYVKRGVPLAHFTLREQLRDPQELRRAFVLREVLGPPVGLR